MSICLRFFIALSFSFQIAQAAPGGVVNNLRIWLDADQGVTGTSAITQWNDLSGNTKHVTQNTTVNQPSLNTAASSMNFHRSVEMDGDRDFLEASGVMPNQTDDITFFTVIEADQSSGTYNQLLGMGTFLAYPHVGFYSTGQVFYSSGVVLPDYRNFSTNEPMRYNEPLIYSGAIDYSIISSPSYNYLNGFQNSDTPTVFSESLHGGDSRFSVGGDDTDEDFDGRMAEFILYNTVLTASERHQVESYLAIKYGQTLTNNYLNSSATAVYTLDGTYNFGVFGLAKDLTGDLDQRISRSVNDSSGLVISTDSDFTSVNTSHSDTLSDGDYLLIGHDNGSVSTTQTSDLSTSFDKRTVREWKVENTSSVGAIHMQFSTLPTLVTGQSYVLLGDNDGDFTSGSTAIKYSNSSSFSDITFPAGTSYFTVAIITNKIEFTLASNSDSEDSGANLPTIAVFGYIPSTTAITLNLSGTASNGTDYTSPSLSIPAGTYDGQPASNLSLTNFSILDDTSAENDKTIIITLDIGAITDFVIGDANNGATTQNAFTYTIIDEDISISASGSLLTATVNSAIANGSDTGNITLQLKEEDGDNISLSNVDLTFTISSGIASFSNNLTTFATTTGASGLASASLKSLLTGAVNISATLDRDKDGGTSPEESVTNGSPASVTFLPGPASATNTTISSSHSSVTTDGIATSTLTVQAKDAQGNNLISSGGTVTLADNSTTAILSGVTDLNNGTYTATISNTAAETVTISGTIAGNTISSGNPTITFTPGTVSAAKSTITISLAAVTTDSGATSTVTVQAKDAQGNNLTSSSGTVTLAENSGTAILSGVTDLSNGTYTATISNTAAETVTISGTIAGNTISSGNPSISFTPGLVSAVHSTISVSLASVTTDSGATSTVTVQAKDAQGNNLTNSGGTVTLAENSETAILSGVTDHSNGSYTATISNTVAETVTISGTIAGNTISSGNPTITFTPGLVSALHSTISVSLTSVISDGNASSTITVQAKDTQGNNLTNSADTVTLATNSLTAVLSGVTNLNNGAYTATISNSLAETVTISGAVAGNPISSGNPTITFTPGLVSAAHSTISVSLTSVTTDGGATSTVTVQAEDAQGNDLTSSSGTVTLAINSATAVLSDVTDHSNGTYTATISNTLAERVTISGTIAGNNISSGNQTITFSPGLASVVTTTLLTSPTILRGNGTDTSVITIQAIDFNGNLLLSGGDTLILSVDNSASMSSVSDHHNGTYTATVTNANIETTTITSTLNGQEFSSKTSIMFIAYGVAQINDSDGSFINGTAPPGTTITILDSQGLTLCTTTANSLTGSYHCAITIALAEGEILTVTTTDLAGNNEFSTITTLFEDSDNDGISDIIEAALKESGGSQDTAVNTDTDGDHLPNHAEFILGSDHLSLNSPVTDGHLDRDNDGVSNAIEYFLAELGGPIDSELSSDTDLDGLPDVTELITEHANMFNANRPTIDGLSDDNANHISNAVEAYLQSFSINDISLLSDYDGDGYADALEVRLASNPLYANEEDTDNDGVNNAIEAFLTGTTNDGGNTELNDRDNDNLPDIFELSVITDRFDPTSDINLESSGDADNDSISDAVELYLYGNTSEATDSSDRDLDGVPDIIEVALGSSAFKTSKPSLWIDIEYIDSNTVEIQGNIAGAQAPSPIFTWDLSGLASNQSNLTDTYPTARSVRISGLDLGTHTIQLSVSRWLNDKVFTSLIDYSFNIKASHNIDTDKDGVANIYDGFNAHMGKEELLHSALGDETRYVLQTQTGQFARLGRIASLSNNQVTNITSTQIEETVEFGQPITLGTPQNPPSIDGTLNIFDFEIVNLLETENTGSVVIPLHHPLPPNPVLLQFDPITSLWSHFLIHNKDNYSSAQGLPGTCPAPEDSQYTQGLTTGHYCLQLQITDGSDNDADHLPNGAIRHLTGIGSGSIYPIGIIPIDLSGGNVIEESLIEGSVIEGQDTQSEPTEGSTSNDEEPKANEGGGSIDHLTLFLLSLLALSVFSSAKAAPSGGNIVHGNGEISTALEQTTITQNSNRLAIDWQSFNVASTEDVTFIQPNGSSIVLNRDFSGLPSQIFGNINANGQVLLLNSAGILIGKSASINVGSFLASDMETTIEDFSLGSFTLTDQNQTQGGITNLGNIQTKGSSGIYIAGQFIDNSGSLLSSNGDVHLATAHEVIISTSDNGLLGVQLTLPLNTDISPSGNLIYNKGDIVSFNGNIYLDLFYSDSIKANTVNNQGLVNAIGISEDNGQVFLTLSPSSELSEEITELDSIIADSQTSSDPNVSTTIEIELTPPEKVSIDTIMPDCKSDTSNDNTDCSKYRAIKNYLSRLLLGGELPE